MDKDTERREEEELSAFEAGLAAAFTRKDALKAAVPKEEPAEEGAPMSEDKASSLAQIPLFYLTRRSAEPMEGPMLRVKLLRRNKPLWEQQAAAQPEEPEELPHRAERRPKHPRTADPMPALPELPSDTEGLRGEIRELFYKATAIEGAPEKRALVYLPHGFDPEKTYPVLYLLHGIGGDEEEWRCGGCLPVLDAIFASGAVRETIVVMPNGRTCTDFRNRASNIIDGRIVMTDNVRGFYKFAKELARDLIPAVEAAYPVSSDRKDRALAGLSMGGMQALNFGTEMTDLFAHIGAFSCGRTTKPAEELLSSLREGGQGLDTLYLVCGDADSGCYPIFEALDDTLGCMDKGLGVRYFSETVKGGKHDFEVWLHGLTAFLSITFPNA